MPRSFKPKAVAAYVVSALVWGTTWFAIRVCIGPGGYPTLEAAALRFALAVVIITPFAFAGVMRLGRHPSRQLLWLCVAGLVNAAAYSLVYKGEESIPGSVAAVLFGSLPLVTAIFAGATRTEVITAGQITGSLIALTGITIIFCDRLSVSRNQAGGVAFLFAAVIATAVYSLILKRKAHDVHSTAATALFLATSTVGLWTLALARGWQPLPHPLPLRPTLALVYMSLLGSVVAFACYIYLLKHVSLMTVSTLVIAEPLIALFVDRLWEHHARLRPLTYAGAVITLSGLLVSLLWKPGPLPEEMSLKRSEL